MYVFISLYLSIYVFVYTCLYEYIITHKVLYIHFIIVSQPHPPHSLRDLLDEAKDYHLMPERRPLLQSFRTRPRCCNDIVGLIYAVGGLTKSGESRNKK